MGRKSLNQGHPAFERAPQAYWSWDADRGGRVAAVCRGRVYRIGARPEPKAVKIRVINAFQLPFTSGKSPTDT